MSVKKKLLYRVVLIILDTELTEDDKVKIKGEIDALTAISVDPKLIGEHLEAGILGNTLASLLAGYPAGEEEKAKADHAERAARILAAQVASSDAARGVKDTSEENDAKDEKQASQKVVQAGNIVNKTRGDA